jgi:hypothetical protein
MVDRLVATYAPGWSARLPRTDNADESPVFIVGTPRSGTSLTEQILAWHGGVAAAGELDDIPRALRELAGGPLGTDDFVAPLGSLDRDTLEAIAGRYLEALPGRAPGIVRITDKMPYNFLHLGFIAQLFPRARIVHCRREPLDSCLSCFFQRFSRGNLQTYRLEHLGAYWRQYARLMAHWHAVLDLPILDLDYEALVADIEGQSRLLVAFLGLEWDPRCLRFHESRRIVNTASFDQVREPVYSRSVGRWRHYAAHLGPLRAALGRDG